MSVKPFKQEIKEENQEEIKPFKQESSQPLDTSLDLKAQTYSKSVGFFSTFSSILVGIFVFLLFVVLGGTIEGIENLIQSKSLSSLVYLVGFLVLFLFLFIFSIKNLQELQGIKKVTHIKEDFSFQKQNPDKNIIVLANFLIKRYKNSQDERLDEIIKEIEDEIKSSTIYANIYENLDKKLLTHLDKKAQKIIHKASIQGALSTAISPIPLIDMGLILYRSIALTREIASTYGFKPGIITTSSLLKKGIINIMFAGVSELASEFTNQATSTTFLSKASKQLGQGAVNGILLARLGYGVLEACRPIKSHEGKVSFFKMLLESLKNFIK